MSKRGPAASKFRAMSAIEAAWLGGMIEADGHTTFGPLQPRRSMPGISVAVTNTSPEVISACLRLTHVGKVVFKPPKPRPGIGSTKPCFRWHVQAWLDVLGVLRAIRPYCTKAQAALHQLSAYYGAPV